MEQQIHITIQFHLATGKVNLNEIVYHLKELKNPLMLLILEKILRSYDDLISERLIITAVYFPPVRRVKVLGVMLEKGTQIAAIAMDEEFANAGIAVIQGGFPLFLASRICPFNFEHQVIEAVIDTNYRRLIEGHSIDISLGGIHNLVVGSDIDQVNEVPIDLDDLSAIMADGTGIKQQKGKRGELRAVIGVTTTGNVEPLGTFANTQWSDIERTIKERIKKTEVSGIPFIYDGELGLDDFLSEVAEAQRCAWHGPRGLYHSLWEDGLKKKDSQPQTDKLKHLIGIELPKADFELLKQEDKQQIERQYQSSKAEIIELVATFKEKGYYHGAAYLENLSQRIFTNVEIWLKTGVIAPKTISLLERIFREIGRRIKRISWGWSDAVVSKLSKMIILKKYSKEKWKQYWKQKLGIEGNFAIQIVKAESCPCPHF
jgi:hypothetical protein